MFNRLYGKVTDRVMGILYNSGTEDLGLSAILGYSYIMSNTAILTLAETSFVLIAGLVPQDVSAVERECQGEAADVRVQVNPQLKGHLKGAVNNGATVDETKAGREVAIRVCEAAGMTFYGDKLPGGWGWRGEIANL